MRTFDLEDEKIGQESEEDLSSLHNISQAVLWSTDWTTETIISQLRKGNIELSPSFQRRDAWGADRKSSFIESIMLGLPIPQIILAELKDKRGSYIVIDGKQRLLSLRQFSTIHPDDEFAPLPLKNLKVLTNLNNKTYEQLSVDNSEFINTFENQSIRTVIIRNWPDQNFLYTVFLRLNTGSLPLSPQELRQALNPGPFTTFTDDFSVSSQQIKDALRLRKPDYRMRDVEIVVRYFAFKNFIESYNGNLKDFLDTASATLNKRWEMESNNIISQADELNNAITATIQIFGEDAFSKYAANSNSFTRIFNRPIFDLMVYYFSVPEIRVEALNKSQDVFSAFMQLCSNDVDFLKSLETSTKNLEPTAKRYFEWGTTLKQILNLRFPVPDRNRGGNGIHLV